MMVKQGHQVIVEYDARQIANWFVARFRADQRELTIMKLLKLVYIVHGWHLGFTGGPLFTNRIEAWRFGPVVVDVYFGFKNQNQGLNITKEYSDPKLKRKKLSMYVKNLLNRVYNDYAHLGSFKLSDMTHRADGPWAAVRKLGGYYARIPDSVIRAYYEERVKQLGGTQ